ncbi:hypothetical protein [Candidatus Sulfurimonas baltica]|uniref:Uncharacterized protein n=1 Tax=Candidatus Sulfurimonas baltica TaxID=2740404 RepID=A0A7S7LXH0_9BACT|nr:hypothetical protein [Candidatus Sulfurimonas baltica]QOY53221.1 hypothetical protein HUE88_05955 [Candidatus Sulfurimonas baltica]
MKTISMVRGVQSSIYRMILLGIGILVLLKYKDSEFALFIFLGVLITIIIALNALIGIAGSVLFNSSYEASLKEYGMRISIFFTDKKSDGFIHQIRASLLAVVGLIIYPIALIITIKELFGSSSSDTAEYDTQRESEITKINQEEANDITIKTKHKKWMIDAGVFSKYYFENKDEAFRYAINNNLDKPEKILI